jgi:hypothetical protein
MLKTLGAAALVALAVAASVESNGDGRGLRLVNVTATTGLVTPATRGREPGALRVTARLVGSRSGALDVNVGAGDRVGFGEETGPTRFEPLLDAGRAGRPLFLRHLLSDQ